MFIVTEGQGRFRVGGFKDEVRLDKNQIIRDTKSGWEERLWQAGGEDQ